MIRVAIVADTAAQARALAGLLAPDGQDDEQVEVVSVDTPASTGGDDEMAYVDVILATSPAGMGRFQRAGPPVLIVGDRREAEPAFRDPIRGWLPANVSPAELLSAIGAIAQNLVVLTGAQANRWRKGVSGDEGSQSNFQALTPRESQVLRMLADGLGNKEIAAQLGISDHTAKFHVAQILAKLGANSRAEAVALGMRRGLVPV